MSADGDTVRRLLPSGDPAFGFADPVKLEALAALARLEADLSLALSARDHLSERESVERDKRRRAEAQRNALAEALRLIRDSEWTTVNAPDGQPAIVPVNAVTIARAALAEAGL